MGQNQKVSIALFLTQRYDWTPASEIAKGIGISSRSVKYYINLINDELSDSILSSNKGYKINHFSVQKIVGMYTNDHKPINYVERKQYILKQLLLAEKVHSITSVSDDLCVSPATLHNELSRIRCELIPKKLNLHIKKDIITITGNKQDIQGYFHELVKKEINGSFFEIDTIQQMFSKADLRLIESTTKKVLRKYEYTLDSYNMISFIIHLAVVVEFSKTGNYTHCELKNSKILVNQKIIELNTEIFAELWKKYEFIYTDKDIFESSLLLTTKIIYDNVENISTQMVKEYVGEDVENLLNFIIDEVKKNYTINFDNKKFIVRFAFHLQKMLYRVENRIDPGGLKYSDIKRDFPLMYSIAVFIAYLISKKIGIILSEDEIAYIALHVGVLIDEEKKSEEKINCVIFTPDYYLLGQSIFTKISSIFADQLNIVEFVTTFFELNRIQKGTLVLSTVPLKIDPSSRFLEISHFVSNEDILKINAAIENMNAEASKKLTKDIITMFFKEDLYFFNRPMKTDIDAIEFLSDRMYELGYVDASFKKNVYEREQFSKSCYGNIAIPHPLKNKAKVSSVAVSIHPEPISWGENKVNIVIMLSLREEDNEIFNKIFDFVAKPISHDDSMKMILQCRTYKEFIDYILKGS